MSQRRPARERQKHFTSSTHARKLRREMTGPEKKLWASIRKQPHWPKFRRQAPIGPFVADFLSHAIKLIIEIDGTSHEGRLASDARRQRFLESEGFKVIRFTNDQVLYHHGGVLEAIDAEVERRRQK